MNLKPQDVLFLLKLVALGRKHWSFNKIAVELGMSQSEVHAAAKRALAARLAVKEDENIWPNIRNLEDFLLHGIQYVFVPERGGLTRGMPTAHASAPMAAWFVKDNEPPPVWPDPEGEVRGESFSPVYKSAPVAAKNDPELYQLLALVDAVRGGRARERDMAKKELKKRLGTSTEEKKNMLKRNRGKIVIGGSIVVSRAALHEAVKRFHIRRLVLFGSAARGELTPDSDIDLLVDFEHGLEPSLGGMVDIQDAFVKLFGGRKVDMATLSILNNPYRKRAIEKDMEELYAA
ncbi:MAG TPA: nucleotidyltransferase domain-containing protein [Gammaproteobacteria bacterium]